ncbi:MAG: ABC-F family ATP-binding cassette domain-containing protein [Rhodospirillales bacterium]|nr:ABC-F family ATP-binding cassette domain-containing protein [Rhodospirillales bacterium]
MLSIQDITYRIAGRTLLEKASLSIERGQKLGLVGRNGTGKTTLFRLISGDIQPDDGDIQMQKGLRMGQVAQEAPSGATSLIDTVLAADKERAQLLAEAETATDPMRIAEVHTRLADIDAERAPARAARILAGLGFDETAQQRPCSDYSGGWRMRVALAAVLFARPDFLLLDEPTNHLDLEAALWLEQYLKGWNGTLLVISHDRRFLNEVVDGIVHLSEFKLTRYAGNYDRFERTRRERLEHQSKQREKQEAERARIQSFVDRFRAKATKARQAQSRLKMLDRMEPIAAAIEDASITFNFPDIDPPPPPLMAIQDVSVGYEPEKPILRKLDLRIDPDDRIALIGANGNGKSTLVKLLSKRLMPEAGKIVKAPKMEVGYFAQHQADELNLDETPYDHAARALPDKKESQVRAHLGRFGFSSDKADTQVASLSGGEKARLLFALMSCGSPNILLLDEPTNHLDVDAREALVQALNAFEGAVILVSHDAHLIELVADRLWLVADGTCKPYDGSLDEYAAELQAARRARRQSDKERTEPETSRDNKKQARKERAEQRQATAALRKTVKNAETRMAKLEAEKTALETRLADPAVYNGSTRDLMDLQLKHADIKEQIAAVETEWLEAQEALEGAA